MPLEAPLRRVAAALAGLRARRWRDGGRYGAPTLAGYWAAWQAGGSPQALLRLAAFRRDLGRPLPRRWVAPLRAAWPTLPRNGRRQALGLLAESAPASLAALPTADLTDAAGVIPALAALAPSTAPALARLHAQQEHRRAAFADWAAARRAAGGLCVVGNAATLHGSGLGAAIDAHAAVVRFNAWRSGATAAAVETVALLAAGDTPVLTVPLAVWRAVVRALDAPPTAGLLTLAWLRELLGSWQGVRCAGIGSGLAGDGRYHAAIAAKPPGRRHAWAREQALVEGWRAEGLQCLDR
jgi:hypothetical protein